MRVPPVVSRLRISRLDTTTQDLLIAVGTFVLGTVLYLTGVYDLLGANESTSLGVRFLVFGALCVLEVFRRRAPATALGAATALLAADFALGSSAPVVIVFFDLVYAATLYGSRALARAMIPIAACGTLGLFVVALALAPDWRAAVLAVVGAVPFLIVPVWWATNIRQHREIAETERGNAAALSRLAELDRSAAVAAERARMARDLHDVIAGHLSAIAIQSEAALSLSESPTAAGQALRSVRENSVRALEEMRAMIGLLRADGDVRDAVTAPAGLAELATLVESARASGLEVTVRTSVADDLPAAVDLAAYRIAQEALTNAVKHAPGRPARIDVYHEDSIVTVEVTNDTVDTPPSSEQSGSGLLNMRERAKALGGSFSAGPAGRGWRVLAVLPTGGRDA